MGAFRVFVVALLFFGAAESQDFDLGDALAEPERPQRNKEEGRCPNDARDIVLVIDGSSSMRSSEFMQLKEFVTRTMKSFPNNTQFALLQYSSHFQEHFDFKQYYRNPDPDHLLSQVKQLGGASHTASAIRNAVRDLFLPHRGARNTATKILVVVTDGLKSGDPLSYPEAVEPAERAGVVRFAIGVGLGFKSTTAREELHAIASHPAAEHTLFVRHFTGLWGTPRQLHEKICSRRGPAVPQPVIPPPVIPPKSPDTCASHSDPQVLQKLEQVLSGLDAINAKLDSLAIRQGKCGAICAQLNRFGGFQAGLSPGTLQPTQPLYERRANAASEIPVPPRLRSAPLRSRPEGSETSDGPIISARTFPSTPVTAGSSPPSCGRLFSCLFGCFRFRSGDSVSAQPPERQQRQKPPWDGRAELCLASHAMREEQRSRRGGGGDFEVLSSNSDPFITPPQFLPLLQEPQRVQEVGTPSGPDPPRDPDPEETIRNLQVQLAAALAEVETVRAVAAVSESTKHEAVEAVRRQCQEEVASHQAILKDTISSYEARLSARERDSWENVWSRLLPRSNPLDSLEKQMEKAQEDTERLRAIVLPMEQEINELKGKLARAEGLVQELQGEQGGLFSSSESLVTDPVPPEGPGDDHVASEEGGVAEKFASGFDSVSIASSSLLVPSPGPPVRRRRSPSPETVSIASSSGTLVPETIYLPPAGYQLVPDSEWTQLHNKVWQQRETVEKALRDKASLEVILKRSSEDCNKQVQVLLAQVRSSEELLRGLQNTVSKSQMQTQEQLADLAASHKRLSYEMQRLSSENEGLRRVSSRDSADKDRRTPSPIQDLQSVVSQQRLESESQLRCAEHQAERLRIEIVSLRERLDQEIEARSGLQGELDREREERELLQASFNSIQSEMERLQQGQEEASGSQAQIDASSTEEASGGQDGNKP
uniref:rab GTPase-binding effector protein 2 n=1 Tax=Euleptes europaea TaxID=460621 RepID=UPI00253F8B51|nr:rab GTPase-binding effector protein 2 [Euleptes europaea]